jgi:acetyltransferase
LRNLGAAGFEGKVHLVNPVQEAAADMLARTRSLKPQAQISGLTIHPMIVRPKGSELIAGIADDPPSVQLWCLGRAGPGSR